MRNFVKYLLLSEGFAVTTFALGWWTVPILAAVWGLASSEKHPARTASVCAAAGWATLLLLDAARGPVGRMGAQLGDVMGVPAAVLYFLTLLFPALLAWSAAALVPSLRRPTAVPG